jgi:hypothetical protein
MGFNNTHQHHHNRPARRLWANTTINMANWTMVLRIHRLLAATALMAAVWVPQPVLAWGSQGHQIVAALAQAQLTPAARKEVDRLLALEPGETLETVSTWADEHKSPATSAWHYVNFPRDSCTYEPERDCPDGKCVVAAINKQIDVLIYEVDEERRLKALKYLVHLVADVHQPLHAGYLDDKGGNKYQLQAFMRGSNLHALWDSGLIRYMDEDTGTTVKRLLTKTGQGKPLSSKLAVAAAEESCRIVGMSGFYPQRKVGMDYVERFTPVMEQRLGLAGSRLAALLNAVLSAQGDKATP